MNKDFEELNNELENSEEVSYENIDFSVDESIVLSLDEIEELSIEQIAEYIQKTELLIDRYEINEFIEEDQYETYVALKKQEKLLYKKLKKMNASNEPKEKGFFDYTKPWMFIYAVILSILGLFPVSPYLQIVLVNNVTFLYDFTVLLDGIKTGWGFYFFYIITMLIYIVPGYIAYIFFKHESFEEKKVRFSFLVMQIVVTIMTLIGGLIFLIIINS